MISDEESLTFIQIGLSNKAMRYLLLNSQCFHLKLLFLQNMCESVIQIIYRQ